MSWRGAALAAIAGVAGMPSGRQDVLSPSSTSHALRLRSGELKRNPHKWAEVAQQSRARLKGTTELSVMDSLPEHFSWKSRNGTNYLSPSRNQHIPK
jgi:hypothetical protein